VIISKNPKRKDNNPIKPVSISAYENSVAGAGVTEPKSEIIEVGLDVFGIVDEIYVVAGNKIKKGDKLFKIDDREAKANYDLKLANFRAAEIQAEDSKQQFDLINSVKDKAAISRDELNKKEHAWGLAEQRKNQAKAELDLAEITLDKSTVKSPIDGEVLKVNVKLGEFYGQSSVLKPSMLIGDLTQMFIRVEVDEIESYKVKNGGEATAMPRGNPELKIPLHFERIEPYIVPKTTITGAASEKIDTRVLELIYSFDNSKYGILVGGQMDVYIKLAK
jgi:RND family efflux transporter MFP subunit